MPMAALAADPERQTTAGWKRHDIFVGRDYTVYGDACH
jgi:hypothetical protein